MVAVAPILRGLLVLMRLTVFALSLGITLISFQAYRQKPSQRLQAAFVGFAFISMGVADDVIFQLGIQQATETTRLFFMVVQTVPFIVGFSMLYLSLYR